MAKRHFPVRPNLDQLKHQAKDLLRAYRRGEADAVQDFREQMTPDSGARERGTGGDAHSHDMKLADAQFVLARSYGLKNWGRLVTACRMTDAIWRGDVDTVREMVVKNPRLIVENARGVEQSNWGPPMSYAANLGQDAIIEMLRRLGAADLEPAFNRACLQGQIATARRLHEMMGRPRPGDGALNDPAYTLNVEGTELLLELGARVYDEEEKQLAPVAMVLETDSRNPAAKHRILELYAEHGLVYPDTPMMALHRGRLDLLEKYLQRDPELVRRRFAWEEIFPPEMGCHDEVLATHGTLLAGTTLLHICADYGELEIARWLVERGADVNTPAAVDADGFGGHTALFSTVVSQANFWTNHHGREPEAPFTRLLLEHGADVNVRASLRKELHPGYEIPGVFEYRDVTAVSWGERFHFRKLVNQKAVEMIRECGGVE
ncbi:ankyrin repeat domain-containing protein [Occallatibacter savannae]|uniref:ankyrin repeat domain-containing protein n=1 Tax=Occallatibacter savannae TaxID=1002691 RepID=UPI000D687B0C|nr:ankyrin repeat domain-containing protein [Occallatibacter savannae]